MNKFFKTLTVVCFIATSSAQCNNNNDFSVIDTNNTNYLYNIESAVFKLLDKYEKQKKINEDFSKKIESLNAKILSNEKNLNNFKLEKFKFNVSKEDKIKLEKFLNQ